jgi:ArsR family transcriptional regulator
MRVKQFNINVGAQIFKAFSEMSRIRVVNLLLERGPLSISDLELILEFTQAKTSRHVNFLRNSGLLSSERKDQWVLYNLNDEFTDLINQMIAFLKKDSRLKKDVEICDILSSNRELSSNKIKIRKTSNEGI